MAASIRQPEQMLSGRVPMSARLEAIVELAERGDILCDVGCDHAHVPIRLLQSGCYRRAIGMDVIAGPLGKAAGNLSLYGMEDLVELRLSNGLDAFSAGEADTLVITGMGGTLMEDILLRQPEKTASFSALVLGPQSDPEKVRAALRRLGFIIKKEKLIFEDGKYYPVIRAESEENPDARVFNTLPAISKEAILGEVLSNEALSKELLSDEAVSGEALSNESFSKETLSKETGEGIQDLRLQAWDMFGPVLLENRDPVLLEFLTRRTAVLERILCSIRQAARDTCKDPVLVQRHLARQCEIEHDLAVFKAALTVYDKGTDSK